MTLKFKAAFRIALMLSITLSGCDKHGTSSSASAGSSGSSGSIAVVNVERVADSLGWADEVHKIQNADEQISKQLEARVAAAKTAYEQTRQSIADAKKFTPEQVTALKAARTRADLEKLGLSPQQIDTLIQASNTWGTETTRSQELLQQLRSARQNMIGDAVNQTVRPAISRVAAASGKTLVFTIPMQNLVYQDVTTDITDKVIEELQKGPPAKLSIPELDLNSLMAQSSTTQPATTQSGTTRPAATQP
jgi:Skp family chaperone for outer membrane proteins